MENKRIISSTHMTVDSLNATSYDWSGYLEAKAESTGNYIYSYDYTSDDTENKKEETTCEHTPHCVTVEEYNKFVEEHLIPEPEQCIICGQDYIEAASIATDTFTEVLGELPDGVSIKPELDAELTNSEKAEIVEAIKEHINVEPTIVTPIDTNITETEVKAVTVKKRAGRPRKK